jgi:hypothetical protein
MRTTKLYIEDFIGNKHNSFHIYITDDSQIEDGDCFIGIKVEENCNDNSFVIVTPKNKQQYKGSGTFAWVKKIILTTDQDLIADGVQAIDDEFLKWYIKNPSCEFVEAKIGRYKHYYKTGEIMGSLSPIPDFSARNMQCEKVKPIYEIIIPQEEPKQETLEEASQRAVKSGLFKDETLFVAGAKWQAERMYTKEDVLKAGEIGEINHHDYKHIVSLLDEAKKINNGK